MKKITWNSFQTACGRYWNGDNDTQAATAGRYLSRVELNADTLNATSVQYMSFAYRLYKLAWQADQDDISAGKTVWPA